MNDPKAIAHLRRMLLLLVVLLTFEGMLRKMNLFGTSVLIFFLKDAVVFLMGMQIMKAKRPPAIDFIWGAYITTILFFVPVIILTGFHDPILALFGARGYLLYPVAGIALFTAYADATIDEVIRFYRILALLIIPTTYFAIYEIYLPSTHWLNESIGGGAEDAFSAGGRLRVSSTFSFVAQFCAFLNAQMFILMAALYRFNDMKFFWKWLYLMLIPLLVISCYVTGSRSAVVGNTAIITIASIFSLLKFEARNALRMVMLIGGILLIITIAQYYFPDFFAAYSARESGKLVGVSNEIQTRVMNSLFSWVNTIFSTPFFGYGIGIMSNGSDQISGYASSYRSQGIWTETDFSTTLFEGGIYLIFVWYSFRYYIIVQIIKRFLSGTRGELAASAAFSVAFVITTGINGTLGIQPPIAIWWWLAVGTSALLWWKSTEATPVVDNPHTSTSVPKKIRGRSAYAERLHGRK